MNKLRYYNKSKHLKACLVGILIGIILSLYEIFTSKSMVSTIFGTSFLNNNSGSFIELFLVYSINVIVIFGGIANGIY